MKLRPGEPCPIHRRKDCCGRSPIERDKRAGKWEQVRPGVSRIRDEHADHSDGYRYRLSRAEMHKVLIHKVREQNGLCAYCQKEFQDFSEVTPDHVKPKGLGGARHDDRAENIVAACGECNSKKGSRRIA